MDTGVTSPLLTICDMTGKRQQYDDAMPSLETACNDFSMPGCNTLFFVANTADEVKDFQPGSTLFAVYEDPETSWRRNSFPPRVSSLLGGEQALRTFPQMAWKSHFLGSTDYIDSIQYDDLDGNPVMLGVDCYKRPFIVFVLVHNTTGRRKLNVLFQRYTDTDRTWAFAGNGPFCGRLHAQNTPSLRDIFGSHTEEDTTNTNTDDDGHRSIGNTWSLETQHNTPATHQSKT
jgi:hypothetical protein